MSYLNNTWNTILDAIFPPSQIDKKIFDMEPALAYETLPTAPPLPIANTWSVFAYKDTIVSRLVWQIKYKKSYHATVIGGYALYHKLQTLFKNLEANEIVILPMPISTQRRRERGFNQCELLTKEIEKINNNNKISVNYDLLKRVLHASRQTLKDRTHRIAETKNIFSMNEELASTFKEKIIIVIDDVITTGSTMNEAMKTLKNSGFVKVYGLSLAH